MDKIQKEKFIKYIKELEEEDEEYESWKVLDRYEKLLYRVADVVQFFREDTLTRDGDVKLANHLEKTWHFILGSIQMHDDDLLHYRTSKE